MSKTPVKYLSYSAYNTSISCVKSCMTSSCQEYCNQNSYAPFRAGNSDATGVSADPESEGAVMKSRGGFGHLGITVPDVFKARLPDGNSQIVRL